MNFYKKFATGLLSLGALASLGFANIDDVNLAKKVDDAIKRDVLEYHYQKDYSPDKIGYHFKKLGVNFDNIALGYKTLSSILSSSNYDFKEALQQLKDVEELQSFLDNFYNSIVEAAINDLNNYNNLTEDVRNSYSFLEKLKLPTENSLKEIEDYLVSLRGKIKDISNISSDLEHIVKKRLPQQKELVEKYEKKYFESSVLFNSKMEVYYQYLTNTYSKLNSQFSKVKELYQINSSYYNFFLESLKIAKNSVEMQKILGNTFLANQYQDMVNKYELIINFLEEFNKIYESEIIKNSDFLKNIPDFSSVSNKYKNQKQKLEKTLTLDEFYQDKEYLKELEKIAKRTFFVDNIFYDDFSIAVFYKNLLPTFLLKYDPFGFAGISVKKRIFQTEIQAVDSLYDIVDTYKCNIFIELGKTTTQNFKIYNKYGKEYLTLEPNYSFSNLMNYLNYFSIGGNVTRLNDKIRLFLNFGIYNWSFKENTNIILPYFFAEFQISFNDNFSFQNSSYLERRRFEQPILFNEKYMWNESVLKYVNEDKSLFGGVYLKVYSLANNSNNPMLTNLPFSYGTYSNVSGGIILGGEYFLGEDRIGARMSSNVVTDPEINLSYYDSNLNLYYVGNSFYLNSLFDIPRLSIKSISLGFKY